MGRKKKLSYEDLKRNKWDDLIDSIAQYETAKGEFKEQQEILYKLLTDFEEGEHFQNDDGIVFQIVKPNGTFVSFKDKGYIRTKTDDEVRGTLSKKKATELGYILD